MTWTDLIKIILCKEARYSRILSLYKVQKQVKLFMDNSSHWWGGGWKQGDMGHKGTSRILVIFHVFI